jgi:hypothetical protein
VQLGLQHRDVVVLPGPQKHLLATQHAAFLPIALGLTQAINEVETGDGVVLTRSRRIR